ncbi:MAG: S9 family peptidase [Aquihabitans sp.]
MTETPDPNPSLSETGPPRPAPREETRVHHGDSVVDPYAWLRDPDDPATVPHLEAENAWTEQVTARLDGLRSTIFEEIRTRTQEDDTSVPVRDGDWWYYGRTETGSSYPLHCRRRDRGDHSGPDGPESVFFDPNPLVEEGGYLALGVLDVSPDGNHLAYAVDRDGDERYELRFRDLRTGDEHAEVIPEVSYGFAWAADAGTCWYTLQDEASRPNRVLRHRLGDDPSHDVVVFTDDDDHFHVTVGPSRSRDVVAITAQSAVTTETWVLDAHHPDEAAQVVAAREHGIEYDVAHRPGELLVVSNHDGADDFAVWRASMNGMASAARSEWKLLVPHETGRRILGVEAFAGHTVVHGRSAGSSAMWLLDDSSGTLTPFEMDEPVGTIHPGTNPSFDTSIYRFGYQSLTVPASIIDQELATGERTVRKRQPVLGGFDPAQYQSAREWAVAADGTQVPISLVWRPDRVGDGPAPTVLYGYGAYEASMDPWFSVARLSLLDRGGVFAIAHVRGGGELGRHWYENGKFGAKPNSFSDFVACARHLVDTGRTSPDLLAARGGSAGGLLMGAVVNLAPELFRAVVAEVPFVDPLTTVLDPTLPLTVIEWDEWGDPLHDAEAYGWIRSYSPYENIRTDVRYPAILATAGLNDPRVGFHEPAKWVARLRDLVDGAVTSSLDERPVLFKVELGAGHGGPSGRYDAWRDEAFVLAFVLDALGLNR